MARIKVITHEIANAEQKALFDAIQSQLGIVPNFLKVFANSPDALKAFLGLHGIANGGSLDPLTRERIALTLESPALALHLSGVQKALMASLPKLLPNLRVTNGVQSRHLSHDPAVVKAYDADTLQHNRISARLARYMAEGGLRVQAKARNWCVPTLLLWAGQDKLVDPAGSRAFAEHVPLKVLQAQCFEDAYHEIFNESTELAAPVLARLMAWLDQQFPAA